jgi:hypothetical protein
VTWFSAQAAIDGLRSFWTAAAPDLSPAALRCLASALRADVNSSSGSA